MNLEITADSPFSFSIKYKDSGGRVLFDGIMEQVRFDQYYLKEYSKEVNYFIGRRKNWQKALYDGLIAIEQEIIGRRTVGNSAIEKTMGNNDET